MHELRQAASDTAAVPAAIIDRASTATTRKATQAEKFAERLARHIQRRTNGMIRQLQVGISPQGITLEGHCAAFYLKQLAQEAVLVIIEDQPLFNRIEVK